MAVLKTDFASDVADIIVNDIQLKRATWYNFLGKPTGYEYGGTLPSVIGSAKDETDIRSESVYFKKISQNSISKIIPRVEWQSGTVYARWDHTRNMELGDTNYHNSFYVLTKGADLVYRVYKCIDNNENLYLDNPSQHFLPTGKASVIKPTFTGVEPVRFFEDQWYNSETGYPTSEGSANAVLGDGYMWKYMYEIPNHKMRQFGNSSFIPVQRSISDSFYNRGAIESVIVTDGGSGYDAYNACSITVTDAGHTTGSGASITISTVSAIGAIQTVSIFGGSGYTAGARLTVQSVYGQGAVLEPVITGGVITGVNIVSGGYGYTTSDNVNVTVGGAKFGIAVQRDAGVSSTGEQYVAGEIIKVTILDAGIGYTSAPSLSVSYSASGFQPTGKFKNGSGVQNPTALLSCVISENKVVKVLVADPGMGYPSNLDTTIVVAGDGTGAEFVPIIANGQIVEVVTQNAGEGYTTISLRASTSAEGVTPASFEAVISQSDLTSDQSYIEQLAVPGALYAAKLEDASTGLPTKGTGYTDSQFVTVTVTGDGVGAVAEAIVYDGEIVDVRFTSPGFGYTYANLTFTDSQRENSNPALVEAKAFAIIPPIGGHGSNAPKELFSTGVCVYSSFRISGALSYINQDYRLYGLIRNPRDEYNKPLKIDELLSTFTIQVSTTAPSLDSFFEKVLVMADTQYGIQKYRVLAVNSSNNELIVTPLGNRNISPSGELYVESNTLLRCTVVSIGDTPVIDRNSGNLVFYSYEQPFTFSENQGIIIKTFLNFSNISI